MEVSRGENGGKVFSRCHRTGYDKWLDIGVQRAKLICLVLFEGTSVPLCWYGGF